jgi:hypothetical protein
LSGVEQLRIEILVDADACPVKPEIYKVAERHSVKTLLVANSAMAFPRDGTVELIIVGKGFDEADDWIAERAGPPTYRSLAAAWPKGRRSFRQRGQSSPQARSATFWQRAI